MIGMSRFRAYSLWARRTRASFLATFRWWHVPCSLFTAGCLYIAPIAEPLMNNPPDIVFPREIAETDFVMTDHPTYLQVTAVDADSDDNLDFYWEWSPLTTAGTAWEYPSANGSITSVLEIDLDVALEGRDIACVVTDGQDDVVVTWHVWEVKGQ